MHRLGCQRDDHPHIGCAAIEQHIAVDADEHILVTDAIIGQDGAKRALALALCGGHNLFLTGPPGSGKSSLACGAAELLPSLNQEDERVVAQIRSFANESYDFSGRPPFRHIQPPTTTKTLLGGGMPVRPGELSLAHAGVLLLDEFASLSVSVRESLRGPLDQGVVHFSRAGVRYHFPASAVVIATQNACPCGRLGVEGMECTCTAASLARHAQSFSAPLLDRFQICVNMDRLTSAEWDAYVSPAGVNGVHIVERLKDLQHGDHFPGLTAEAERMLQKSVDVHQLSGRGVAGVRAVAITIARFDGFSEVNTAQVAEALSYRRRSQVR